MKILQMIRSEFARLWATKMARLAFVALMCVPLLYGGLYLWANQDPYAKLDQVPVALVVSDEGVQHGDTTRNVGDEVAKQLIDDGSFDWNRVSAKEAKRGVGAGDYDFSVTIPKDFTAALESSRGTDPHRAEVLLTTNDANSYLASTIGEQAVKQIRQQIVKSVNQEAAKQFLDGLAQVRTSLGEAHEGTVKLGTGAGSAKDGAKSAKDGAGKLATGLDQLRTGTASLPAQTEQLANGAAKVAGADAEIARIGREVAGGSQQAVDRLAGDRQAIIDELKKAGLDQAAIDRVAGRLDQAGSALREANTKVQGASAQLDQLQAGSQQVADGARKLADATPQLANGIATAADGAGTLTDGLGTLETGLGTLQNGIGTLGQGLAAGIEKIPASDAALRAKQAQNISDPVDVQTSKVTSAGTYGAGLAPFFVSLAAWIGIYALFLILKPVSRRAMTALRSPLPVALAGWATPALLGAIQMAALYAIVTGTLGFRAEHPWAVYGMMALASATFAAIILALNVWLGSVGQFMGLVLMVLQLVTAGGTFPWQTLPEPLATLHHYLPMSFAVDGIRQVMYGGNLSHAVNDALLLGLVLVAAVLLSAVGVGRQMRSRTLRDLQPSLIG
ncbi:MULTISPECIES: YhgE/Pip family protein [unclassified Leucobacter]|uniref:YhgE/Pip family protein n=1 Tax=unclassified Leucobacter TaxID=2621730 RepID=UPI000621A443|nr:YhgE/Pip family protein [Leucobacter sp. Ag1]KKI22616.1 membrane protein [Leucobacter sp. Ag1]